MTSTLPFTAARNQPRSWILLEHTEYASEWGINKDEKKRAFFWLSDNKPWECEEEHAVPDETWNLQAPFVCIVCLPKVEAGGTPLDLPEAFLTAIENQNPATGIWCHYGGNLNLRPSEIAMQWANWPRLSRKSRDRLARAIGEDFYPVPFSGGQVNVPGYLEFRDLRRVVAGRGDLRSLRLHVHQRLSVIWLTAHKFLDLEQKMHCLSRITSAAFALKEIKRRLAAYDGDIFEKCRYAMRLFKDLGIATLTEEPFSGAEDKWTSYMKVLFACISGAGIELPGSFNQYDGSTMPIHARQKHAATTLEELTKQLTEFESKWNIELNGVFDANATVPTAVSRTNGGSYD